MLLVCVSIAAAVPLGATILENFRVITPGIAFRSGQLSGDSLQSHIDRYHIQSVINLRGANPGDDWYESECAIATKNGVIHVDMPTDSLFPPTAEELHTWMAVLDRCPKPLLVHCQSGIDRTGLVAAICVLRCDPHGTIAEARSQLGIFYGHLPWKENRARFLGLIDAYEKWLRHRQLQHTPARFEEWALTAYRGPSN